MSEVDIEEKIARLNVLLKMFDVKARVEHLPGSPKPFAMVGLLAHFNQGIHRATFEEIQVLADSYMRRDPSIIWNHEKKKPLE